MNGIDEPSMKFYTLLCICYLLFIQRPVHTTQEIRLGLISICVLAQFPIGLVMLHTANQSHRA